MLGNGRVRRALGVTAVLACAVVGVQVVGTGQALAHANAVTGSATCSADGTYVVTWTVANDYQSAETVTVTSHDPGPSTVSPESFGIDKLGTAQVIQRAVPGGSPAATLAVSGVWSVDGFTRADSGTVALDGTCLPTHAPTAPGVVPGSCTGGAVVSGAIVIPADEGVQYLLDGTPRDAGTFSVAPGTHEVLARSTVYDLTGQTTFTLTVTEPSASCAVTVTPVAPTVVQASCNAGSVLPGAPLLTLAHTDGITYAVDAPAPYLQGQSIVISATADADHHFAGNSPAGWTRIDSTHETFALRFDQVTCSQAVSPAAPTVTTSECTSAGTPTAPGLTLATTGNVTYSASDAGPYSSGGSVVVTARSVDPYRFATALPTGWTFVDAHTVTFTVTFDPSPTCVSPQIPAIDQATCPAGHDPGAPTLTLPATSGVRYSVSAPAPYAAGQQVLVTADVLDGYRFTPVAPTGWTFVSPARETFAVTFSVSPHCAQVAGPAFVDSSCVGTQPAGATYTIPSVTGVDYRVAGSLVAAGTYHVRDGSEITVTSTPQAGYTLSGQTTFTHRFPATPDCRTAVVAAAATFSDSTCTSTVLEPGTYTIPAGLGVDYYVGGARSAAGTYPAATGTTVTVTALARDGYVLSGLTVFSHVFAVPTGCGTAATPAAPTFADQTCASGQVALGASYTVPTTTGVVYLVDGAAVPAGSYPVTSGTSISVTARPASGYILAGTAVFTHDFPVDASCTGAVQVVAATFDPTRCTGSTPVPASYTIPSVNGVDYLVRFVPDGSSAESVPAVLTRAGTYSVDRPGTVTVLARPQTGFTLQGRSLFTFPVATSGCAADLVPASASFQDPVCLGGTRTSGAAYVIPLSVGAVYSVAGRRVTAGVHPVADGSLVTVEARPAPGYALTGVTEWTHSFLRSPACSPTAGLSGPPFVVGLGSGGSFGQSGSLASTGVPTALLVTGGLVLLLSGAGLVVLGRRRPTASR